MTKRKQDIDLYIKRAKEFLNHGDARSAMEELEEFARNDSQGVHFETPEFYRILWASQDAMEIDSYHGINRGKTSPFQPAIEFGGNVLKMVRDSLNASNKKLDTAGLTWISAMDKGERLLKEGKAKESIEYFKFSIKDNPGECGTYSSIDIAKGKIKAAEALILRMRNTDRYLKLKKK